MSQARYPLSARPRVSNRAGYRALGGGGGAEPFRYEGGGGGAEPFTNEGGGGGAEPFTNDGGGGGAEPFRYEGGGGGAEPLAIIKTSLLCDDATTVFRLIAPTKTSMARSSALSLRDIVRASKAK